MSAYTPGPWYVGHDAVNPLTGDATLSVGVVGRAVAAVVLEPDARLIAAAPEMLAELKDIAEYIVMDRGAPEQKYPENMNEADRIAYRIRRLLFRLDAAEA
jgi:hypothetical protein